MNRRNLKPGDMVMGLSEVRGESRFRYGVVIGVRDDGRSSHHGCETRITVMWSEWPVIGEQCDCEVIVPAELDL